MDPWMQGCGQRTAASDTTADGHAQLMATNFEGAVSLSRALLPPMLEILLERGATEVWAMATHGVLSGPAVDRLKNAPLERLILTNTLPLPQLMAVMLRLEMVGYGVFGWFCGVCWGSSTAWECCVSGGEAVLGFSFFL